jgi:hypothetical protein
MNPDVFITIAFVGIVFLVALLSIVIVLPQAERENADVEQSESSRPRRARDSALPTTRRSNGNSESDASVH